MAKILEYRHANILSESVTGIEFDFEPTEVILTTGNMTITQNPSDDDMKIMKDNYQIIITQGSTGVDLYDTGVCINLIGNRLFFTNKNIANQAATLTNVVNHNYPLDHTLWFVEAFKLIDEVKE